MNLLDLIGVALAWKPPVGVDVSVHGHISTGNVWVTMGSDRGHTSAKVCSCCSPEEVHALFDRAATWMLTGVDPGEPPPTALDQARRTFETAIDRMFSPEGDHL